MGLTLRAARREGQDGWHQIPACDILIWSTLKQGNPCSQSGSEMAGNSARDDSAEIEKTMPKLKTHTGAAKRFSKTGSGKIKRHQTKMRHILTSKLPKTKRKLGKSLIVSDADHDKVARMIPYA
jgi:large subunit ribosomal protein L35